MENKEISPEHLDNQYSVIGTVEEKTDSKKYFEIRKKSRFEK